MRRLILIRHSLPEIRREVPAAEWQLSGEGLARARALAGRIRPGGATHVFTSIEPKALETARALAREWGLEVIGVPGLHEHERPEARMLTREAFEAKVRELYARPGELVFGAETADQARRRFTKAIMRLVAGTSSDIVVVTHGTVLALFVSEVTGVDPFTFWKRQEMPFAVTLELPEMRLGETTTLVTGSPEIPPRRSSDP